MWSTIRAMLPPAGAEFLETTASKPRQAWDAAAAAASAGAGLVVAIGGDGTLNEALNGVMSAAEHQRPALAFVPGGTANILARALGLPRSLDGIGRVLRDGSRLCIDVGRVNGRYFATIAALGFDAEVVAGARRLRRWISSKPAHVASILTTLAGYRATPARVSLDGDEHTESLTFLAAANTEWYGGGLRLAPGARADDGQFLVVYGRALSRLETLDVMIRAFSGRHLRHRKVAHRPAASATVECERPMALHADGEWLGRLRSIAFEIVPRAVHVIVPGDGTPNSGRRL
jgi:YegS/Rv2252/BmrU family lipid kinase